MVFVALERVGAPVEGAAVIAPVEGPRLLPLLTCVALISTAEATICLFDLGGIGVGARKKEEKRTKKGKGGKSRNLGEIGSWGRMLGEKNSS